MRLRSGAILAVAMASLTLPTAALSQTAVAAAARTSEDNEVVCKREKKPNSRFEEKTCKTRLQWEQIRLENQRNLKEYIDRPMIETRRGG